MSRQSGESTTPCLFLEFSNIPISVYVFNRLKEDFEGVGDPVRLSDILTEEDKFSSFDPLRLDGAYSLCSDFMYFDSIRVSDTQFVLRCHTSDDVNRLRALIDNYSKEYFEKVVYVKEKIDKTQGKTKK